MTTRSRARLLAFYLPQFHPIPENDAWWGDGFTEWTNVTQARPLFRGHHQPRRPTELGYYDLRRPETRHAQAALARAHGIEAFCYWHYWFAGRRLLERPFEDVLRSGTPDFPFCLAWANQSWSGIWHGAPDRLLIEQTYPGDQDFRAHFEAVLPALRDPRYVTVDGRPFFAVYRPHQLPEPRRFTDLWRELAARRGLPGLFLVGIHDAGWDPAANGFDARAPLDFPRWSTRTLAARAARRLRQAGRLLRGAPPEMDGPERFDYRAVFRDACRERLSATEIPVVWPNWDNTPRSGRRGYVLTGSLPRAFRVLLDRAITQVEDRPMQSRLVLIRSWNEWAEGNYLEPDEEFGRQYLEAVRASVTGAPAP